MDWITLRLIIAHPARMHSLLVAADRKAIEEMFADGLSKPRVTIPIAAIHLPLRHAQNVIADTERLAVHLAERSTLTVGGQGSRVRWTGELVCDDPAPFEVDLRFRSPLMSIARPWLALRLAFSARFLGADGSLRYDEAHVRPIRADGRKLPLHDLAERTRKLENILVAEETRLNGVQWQGDPAVLRRGSFETQIPAGETWRRALLFERHEQVWTIGMAVHAVGARRPRDSLPAVVIRPFGLIAYDGVVDNGRVFPRDLATTCSGPPIGDWNNSIWWLWQTCRVTQDLHPINSDDRPTQTWNRLVGELHESLPRVKGSDPASLTFTVDRASEHWRVTYHTTWDSTSNGWTGSPYRVDLAEPITVVATFRRFFDHEGNCLVRSLTIADSTLGWDKEKLAWKLTVSVDDTEQPPNTDRWVRIGALDVRFGPYPPLEERGEITFWIESVPNGKLIGALSELKLGLSGFVPAAQDPGAEDSETQGQLILRPDAATIGGTFVLHAHESLGADQSHKLSFKLFRGKDVPAPPKFSLLVLDTEPFLIARVDVDLGDNREIGNRSSEQSWEFGDASSEDQAIAQLVLPPQVIGEETVKHYESFFEPTPGALIVHRFSPVGTLSIRRSALHQRYTEAPWNVRRLFGHARQELPGALFVNATTELIYGLKLTVRGGKLTRISDALHRAGPIVAFDAGAPWRTRLDEQKTPTEHATKRAEPLIRGRVAMLTPYEIGGERGWWTSHVVAEFRDSRRVADPISPDDPQKGVYMPVHEQANGGEWGIRGGVDWGFESRNILDETRNKRISTSGEVFDLSLSALGGGGLVKAGFANDKTTIFAEAFLGRTFFTSIERIGRVGVLWNVAKHIIVYERSTKGSEQFPDPGHFSGRAVLRKVREVVQIMETLRPFPDASSEARATSLVRASRFQSEPIEVDSRWGRDVSDGWEIPLYREGGPTQPPQAFLELAGVDGEKAGTISARITNTDNLYFFTSTRNEDGPLTNAWRPVIDVDFPSSDIPVRDAAPSASRASVEPGRARLPDAPSVAGGMARFTFMLDAGGLRANVGANRTSTPTGAIIENVTLARRGARNLNPEDPRLPAEVRTTLKTSADVHDALIAIDDACAEVFAPPNPKIPDPLGAFLAVAKERVAHIRAAAEADPMKALVALQGKARLPDLSKWIDETAKFLLADAHAVAKDREAIVRALVENALGRLRGLENVGRELATLWRAYTNSLLGIRERLDSQLEALGISLLAQKDATVDSWNANAREVVSDLVLFGSAAQSELGTAVGGSFKTWSLSLDSALGRAVALTTPEQRTPEAIDAILQDVRAPLEKASDELNLGLAEAERLWFDVEAELTTWNGKLDEFVQDLVEQVVVSVEEALTWLKSWATARQKDLSHLREEAAKRIGQAVDSLEPVWDPLPQDGELEAMRRLAEQLRQSNPHKAIRKVLEETLRLPLQALEIKKEALASELESHRRRMREDPAMREAMDALEGIGDRGMRVLRAFGSAPRVPGLDFTRNMVAYYFLQGAKQGLSVLDGVHFTPTKALVGGAEKALKALALQWPTGGFGETLLPDYQALAKSLLRDIFPDFAGINLSNLLKDVSFPGGQADAVKIRHGFDSASKQAWVELNVAVEKASAPLFNINPVCLELRRVKFDAIARVDVAASGASRHRTQGVITADWCMMFGGQGVITLRDTRTEFEDGRLSFRIDPTKIELPGALRFLVDVLKAAAPTGDSGLRIEFVHEGGGSLPVGVRAVLGLAMPTLGAPPLSISNLALRSYLEIAMLSTGFTIGAGLSLSSRERPFQLAILFLSGGGWLDVAAHYRAGDDVIPRLSVGIAAGASLQFDIGIASGGVSLLLDVGVDWTGGAPLSIILGITLRGELQVLGLISVSLTLRLEGEYRTDGSLYARGRLRLKIKICWFIKIDVDVGFNLVLAGKPKTQFAALDGGDPIELYLSTFGGVL